MDSADLSVSKTASPSTVSVGQQFTYTITVKNQGPDDATGVILTDPIPANACLHAIATSPQVGHYTYTGNMIQWNIGNLTTNEAEIDAYRQFILYAPSHYTAQIEYANQRIAEFAYHHSPT